jgi:lysozyme
MPQMNGAGYDLLKTHEGCILYAYDDANDKRVDPGMHVCGTLTIGYGHTGSDVAPGLTWTQQQADQALARDAGATASEIARLITAALNDNQFSAFVCFAFNIGPQAFAGSSALHLANQGDLINVPAHIALWDKTKIDGKMVTSPGLQNRRSAEIVLWNTPIAPNG